MSFDYEQLAYHNAPMPESLSPPDVFAFLSLRALYEQYKAGTISKALAQKEKKDIVQKREYMVLQDELYKQGIRLFGNITTATERLEKAIKKRGDIEGAAKALHFAIYNVVPEWKGDVLKNEN